MTDTTVRGGGSVGTSPSTEWMTFDHFVVGPENEFPYVTARELSEKGIGARPYLFCGERGVGKTHLLRAAFGGFARYERFAPREQVPAGGAYISIHELQSIQLKTELAAFLRMYRDPVVLDGAEYFSTSDDSVAGDLRTSILIRIERGLPFVCGANFSVSNAFTSTLRSGLTCGFETYRLPTRVEFARRFWTYYTVTYQRPVVIDEAALLYLADYFSDSLGELQGALTTLIERAALRSLASVDLDQAKAQLFANIGHGPRKPTVADIQKATAEHFGLKVEALLSERRNRAVARPRQIAMWVAKQLTTRSLPDIGRRFGGRDHTTVLHAVRRIDALRVSDIQVVRDCDAILRMTR